MRRGMAEHDDEQQQTPKVTPFLIMAFAGLSVACFSWESRDALGGALWLPLLLGTLFAVVGFLAIWWTVKLGRLQRVAALPAAPALFEGSFAPDFRRNLEKLYAALPEDRCEMTLEDDYAFWYNAEHTLELVLAPDGWLGFFMMVEEGSYRLPTELIQRAVTDSPFATHPVALELLTKYADEEKAMPLSCIAWCSAERFEVYPYDAAEALSRFYADNLFAPTSAFDSWLQRYLLTGNMHEQR